MKLIRPSAKSLLSALALMSFAIGCNLPFDGDLSQDHGALVPPTPPTACSGLGESACVANAACVAEYVACPAIACDDPTDPNCGCAGGGFEGCRDAAPVDPCDGLSESQCNAAPGCVAEYNAPGPFVSSCMAIYRECVSAPTIVPPPPCQMLEQAACEARADECQPIYEQCPANAVCAQELLFQSCEELGCFPFVTSERGLRP